MKLCCCKAPYSQCFLCWTCIAWLKFLLGIKTHGGEDKHVGSRLFWEQVPRGILLLREFGGAGSSTDHLHLYPDSGCHRSKVKHMLKNSLETSHIQEVESFVFWISLWKINPLVNSQVSFFFPEKQGFFWLKKWRCLMEKEHGTGVCYISFLGVVYLYYPCPWNC